MLAFTITIPYSVVYWLMAGIAAAFVIAKWRKRARQWVRVTDIDDLAFLSCAEGATFTSQTVFPSGKTYVPEGKQAIVQNGRLRIIDREPVQW